MTRLWLEDRAAREALRSRALGRAIGRALLAVGCVPLLAVPVLNVVAAVLGLWWGLGALRAFAVASATSAQLAALEAPYP